MFGCLVLSCHFPLFILQPGVRLYCCLREGLASFQYAAIISCERSVYLLEVGGWHVAWFPVLCLGAVR